MLLYILVNELINWDRAISTCEIVAMGKGQTRETSKRKELRGLGFISNKEKNQN